MEIEKMYLDLLAKALIDYHRTGRIEYQPFVWRKLTWSQKPLLPLERMLRTRDYSICKMVKSDIVKRKVGEDWPYYADSMIGLKRLENIRDCVIDVIKNKIEGDLIETGVWRGGATIFMRGILKAYSVTDKTVWAADSFEGLPKPDDKYIHDKNDTHHQIDLLKVSLEDVKNNFLKYDLLDDQVKFLKGWFKDTLPNAPIKKLSLLRLDGDMYESTMDGLVNLYPKLSQGGYIIIDDWGIIEACRKAVEDYRLANSITDEIIPIDRWSVYWKKT